MKCKIIIPCKHCQYYNYYCRDRAEITIFIQIRRSRFLWQEIKPLVFHENSRLVENFLRLLMEKIARNRTVDQKKDLDLIVVNHATPTTLDYHPSNTTETIECDAEHFKQREITLQQSMGVSSSAYIWIEPDYFARLERSFESRMLAWEHECIRAQSLAGFYATLGGGYFMCAHWKTAVALAKQQQQLAAFLGDSDMFFKCIINQAYNYIYSGRFRSAKRIIRSVYLAAKHSKRQVLVKMCASAWRFANSVQKTMITDDSNASISTTTDDFARIRIKRDASSDKDWKLPLKLSLKN